MRKTAAEYQKEYRARKKAAKNSAPDISRGFVQRPISDFRSNLFSPGLDRFEFIENFVPFGLQFPEGFFDEKHTYDVDDLVGAELRFSGRPLLERLEGLAGAFLDAAMELHQTINEFKLAEIDARISEIENADLSEPEARAKALRDIVALQEVKSQLDGKSFRRSFAEIAVKDLT